MECKQSTDDISMELKIGIQNYKVPKTVQQSVVMDVIINYISDVDSNSVLRLYVPEQLRDQHDLNDHMGIGKRLLL